MEEKMSGLKSKISITNVIKTLNPVISDKKSFSLLLTAVSVF